MRLTKIDEFKYKVGQEGLIYLDNKNHLYFDINTKTLIDILPKFLEKIKKEGLDFIYYIGDSPYLKDNYFTKNNLTTIYLRPYQAFVISEYMELEGYREFFKQRGNWELMDNKDLFYDLYFVQGGNILLDRTLWKIKSYLTNRPDRKSLDITEKDRIKELVSPELREGFLLPQKKFTLSPRLNPMFAKDFIEKNGVVILKPTDGFGGKSIYVIENFVSFVKVIKELKAIKNKDKWSTKKNKYNEGITKLYWVLEKYIINPHLYKGKKYHFRLYYIIGKDGKGYIYKKFRVARAFKNYIKGDYTNKDIHDTHFVKRKETDFVFLDDFLKKKEYDKTLEGIIMLFNNISKHLTMSCYDTNKDCFQIFGCDLMLEEDLNLKLIELNTNPGFKRSIKMSEEILESCLYHIVDPIFPPKNKVEDPGHFIQIYGGGEKVINPKGLFGRTIINEKEYIRKVSESWHSEGYGPRAGKDKTGGYYLACMKEINRERDFHIHLVGPEGKTHPNAWSRKIKERRRWENIDFRLTPKETAFRIYVKSGYKNEPVCKAYNKNQKNNIY